MHRRLAFWMALLALGVNVLAPGMCLARMLATAPLGAICSASAPGADATQPSPSDDSAGWHRLQHCSHCAVSIASIAPTSSLASLVPPPTAAPLLAAAPAPAASPAKWRPPPRGPPVSA
jgi:Protein of unknown function (DUF2946)